MNQTAQRIWRSILICFASLYLTFLVDLYTINSIRQYLFVFLYFIIASHILIYLKNRFIGKCDRAAIFGATAAALIIVCLFQNTFLPLIQETTISLTAAGQNDESTGREIWLAEVTMDGSSIPLSELEITECVGWIYGAEWDDYVYYPKSGNEDNILSFQITSQKLDLRFASGPWCGIVKIITPNDTESLDLSSTNSGSAVDYTVSTARQYSILERFCYNSGAVVLLAFLISALLSVLKHRFSKSAYPAIFCAVSRIKSAAIAAKIIVLLHDLSDISNRTLKYSINQFRTLTKEQILRLCCYGLLFILAAGVLLVSLPGKTGTTIEISGGDKHLESKGYEIWLREILVDQAAMDISIVSLPEGWIYTNNAIVFTSNNTKEAQPLRLELPPAEHISLVFGSHAWSGIAQIKDGAEIQQIDLYSMSGTQSYSVQSTKSYEISTALIVVWSFCILLLYLLCGKIIQLLAGYPTIEKIGKLLFSVLFVALSSVILGYHQQQYSIIYYVIFFISLLAICRIYYSEKQHYSRIWFFLGLLVCINVISLTNPTGINQLMVSAAVMALYLLARSNSKLKTNTYVQIAAMAAIPFLCVLIIEIIGNTALSNLSIPYWGLNIAIWGVLMLIFSGLLPYKKWGWYLGTTVALSLGVINHFVIKFKMFAFMPIDILNIRTGMDVLSDYSYDFSNSLTTGILIYVFLILLIYKFVPTHTKQKSKMIHMVFSVGLVTISILFVGYSDVSSFFHIERDPWNSATTYSKYGTTASFISYFQAMKIPEPPGYSPEYTQEILSNYAAEDSVPENEQPTIIAIMNESFADLRQLGDLGNTDNVMWYVDSLDDCIEKGIAYTSVRGGGTCNSEFEFLTGSSMSFFEDAFPYTQFNFSNVESLVSILKDQGYHTIAIHPANAVNYRRATVYQELGFDDFYSLDYFEDCEKLFMDHTTDYDSYVKMINLIESTDEPLFLFNVTIQNHGGYSTTALTREMELVHVDKQYAQYDDVLMYLSLINESNHALKFLIDYYRNSVEKVIICVFGDHQPGCLDTTFEAALMEETVAENDLAQLQLKQGTPYFIWANYDVGEKQESDEDLVSSPNYLGAKLLKYAGCQTSAYQEFMLDMSEDIPVLNRYGYLDTDGNWNKFNTASQYQGWFEKYKILQYDNIFSD